MLLGIEIGGTKLQLAVAKRPGDEPITVERVEVDAPAGAKGILERIAWLAPRLVGRHAVTHVGCGFVGSVEASTGTVIKSHQIDGWDDFPLADWLEQTTERPAAVANDCNLSALAEARCGAGVGYRRVLYVTVGTGVGGGLVIDGELYAPDSRAVCEIGHLRPGLSSDRPELTVEAIASGWGIAAEAQDLISGESAAAVRLLRSRDSGDRTAGAESTTGPPNESVHDEFISDLLSRCGHTVEWLTAKMVGHAAREGNGLAQDVIERAVTALGWAIAQTVTITAADRVIVGGGVSLLGEVLFFTPLREAIDRYLFPPLMGTFDVVDAALGELVTVQGALCLADDLRRRQEAG